MPEAAHALLEDRVSLSLCLVFVLAGVFYLWTAGTTVPLSLTAGQHDFYNRLAAAFLHLHLSIGSAPAQLLSLPEPHNPEQNGFLVHSLGIGDLALYGDKFYLTWGPAPVIVLLVPMHLLGLAPTPSVTVAIFSIAGLGFVLGTLRVVLRQIGSVPLWMCVLAALTLALASAVPFMLRRPAVYEEAISGGYCFAMAGVWLAIAALAEHRVSLTRLALMSLCFGLAIASRPTLILPAALLVLVYLSLRRSRPRRSLLLALFVPIGVCVVLLLTYNQVRFGNPLENGTKYQLAGIDQETAPFDSLSYVPPGMWFYGVSVPRISALFPFVVLRPPPISYPGTLSALYVKQLEATGGMLPMAPIAVFVLALPWIWRRRPAWLGRLSLPLLALAGAGIACMLFLAYVFFSTTERYEVDFTTLLLLGAVAGWLALSSHARGWRRRSVRIVGGLLAAWGCLAGVAISFTGYYNLLATEHPGTWRTLEDLASPVSTAIVAVEGHPVMAELSGAQLPLLGVGEPAEAVVVSPDTRRAELRATLLTAVRTGAGIERGNYATRVLVSDPGYPSTVHRISPGGEVASIPVRLKPGINRIAFAPLAAEASHPPVPNSQQLLYVESVSLQ